MSNLIREPQKYLPSEWRASNLLNYTNSEQERAAAERLRAETDRLCKDTEITTAKTQESVNYKFSQRIREISFWKQEVEKKIEQISRETELLLEKKNELEDALLNDTAFPLDVAKSCLEFRAQREKIDLVHDVVEVQLIKEVEVLHGVQALLQSTHDQTVEQIRLLRAAKYNLEKDLTEKLGALSLDESCATLNDKSEAIYYCQEEPEIQSECITHEQWTTLSNENILKTEKECNASSVLRGVISSVLEQTRADISKQRDIVNLEFSKRIHETSHAKQKLECHLELVMAELISMQESLSNLEKSIQDKERPMMLAQTRLDIRSYRSTKENVRDAVQDGLKNEVGEINSSMTSLQNLYITTDEAVKGLRRNQLTLQEDIEVKSKSLFIDQEQCMALRSQLGKKQS